MKYFSVALIYIAFFSLIGLAIYFTETAHCLWALLLMPSFTSTSDDKESD